MLAAEDSVSMEETAHNAVRVQDTRSYPGRDIELAILDKSVKELTLKRDRLRYERDQQKEKVEAIAARIKEKLTQAQAS